jgi:DNA-binding FadR family transcriptional regulator
METNLGRTRLSEQIEEAILNAIKSGEFAVGEKLPSERTLMDMFNVGRPSVKEALLMLERKGFVSLRRGVAPIVVEPTPESAMQSIGDMVSAMIADESRRSDFFGLRTMLESAACYEAAKNCSSEAASLLLEALTRCREACGDANKFRDADKDFHGTIIGLSNNSVVKSLHEALIDWGLFHPEDGPDLEAIHLRVIKQHEDIVMAITKGDGPAVVEAVQRHLMARKNEK